jgi:hypothetical protein
LEQPNQLVFSTTRVPAPRPGLSPEETQRELMLAAHRAFLDDQVPALNDRTPRAATGDPDLRPKLIHLMKQRVRSLDERNLETGGTDDLNWMLRELGLTEIIFDPSPPRAALAGQAVFS